MDTLYFRCGRGARHTPYRSFRPWRRDNRFFKADLVALVFHHNLPPFPRNLASLAARSLQRRHQLGPSRIEDPASHRKELQIHGAGSGSAPLVEEFAGKSKRNLLGRRSDPLDFARTGQFWWRNPFLRAVLRQITKSRRGRFLFILSAWILSRCRIIFPVFQKKSTICTKKESTCGELKCCLIRMRYFPSRRIPISRTTSKKKFRSHILFLGNSGQTKKNGVDRYSDIDCSRQFG